jgi:hypothetical protein
MTKNYRPPLPTKIKFKKLNLFLFFIIGIVIEFRLIGKVIGLIRSPPLTPKFYTLCTTLIYEKDVMWFYDYVLCVFLIGCCCCVCTCVCVYMGPACVCVSVNVRCLAIQQKKMFTPKQIRIFYIFYFLK